MTTTTTPITPFLEEFLVQSLPPLPHELCSIFDSGDKFGKKSMQISMLQASFLRMLLKISGARNILEVGTYVGFSASVLASANHSIESVYTCEIIPEHMQTAIENVKNLPFAEKIHFFEGDAKITLRSKPIKDIKFDLFFLDGDKENYDKYLSFAETNLNPQGLLIVDNTLFKGEIVGGTSGYSKGIKRLLDKISHSSFFDISHVTIGDGMLIARRR